MSIRKSSSKLFIDNLSDRLQKLEVDRAIAGTSPCIDPEEAEIEARYAKYKEEKAEKYKRLGREPTYLESWSELTFGQFRYCIKGQGTPEERYQSRKKQCYAHDSAVEGSKQGCNPLYGCIPECRYYADKGRIEDEEAIEWLDKGKARLYPSCQLSIRLNTGRCCSEEEYNNGLKGIE